MSPSVPTPPKGVGNTRGGTHSDAPGRPGHSHPRPGLRGGTSTERWARTREGEVSAEPLAPPPSLLFSRSPVANGGHAGLQQEVKS